MDVVGGERVTEALIGDPDWPADMGGAEMRRPQEGLYAELLQALMARSGIASRRYAADEAELCFAAYTLFQALCLDSDGFVIGEDHGFSAHAHCVLNCPDQNAVIRVVAGRLSGHAQPVVEALHRWSGFSEKALWAMASSSWVGQLRNVSKTVHLPEGRLRPYLTLFYEQWRPLADSLPHWYYISEQGKNHYFHVRASYCLYFKGKSRHFCASCPVIKEEERIERNRWWINKVWLT